MNHPKLAFRYFCLIVDFRVVVGYDDLVYTSASGFDMILQHGQSWTFECRYKLNSWADGDMTLLGIPEVNPEIVVKDEIEFEFNYFADDTYNKVRVKYLMINVKNLSIKTIERPVIDISPNASPLPEPFNIGIKMEEYGDSWVHLQQCELIGEDGDYREVIVKDGCSTDSFLYRLQGGQNGESFLQEELQKLSQAFSKVVNSWVKFRLFRHNKIHS